MNRIRMQSGRGRSLGMLLLVGALTLLGARRAAAQGSSKCSSDPYAGNFVDDIVRVFNGPENAPMRSLYHVDTLASTDTRSLVTDEQLCGKLISATRAAFKTMYAGHMSLDSKDLYFFEMGKYYVVMALPSKAATAGFIISGPQPIIIFTHTYDYITNVLW